MPGVGRKRAGVEGLVGSTMVFSTHSGQIRHKRLSLAGILVEHANCIVKPQATPHNSDCIMTSFGLTLNPNPKP
eukprot:scaffold93854_cov21-Tisochrysis_lutea.AAC.1